METSAGFSRLNLLRTASPLDKTIAHLHATLQTELKQNKNNPNSFVKVLSKFLLDRKFCAHVANCFPKQVLQILCENIKLKKCDDSTNHAQIHTENCLLLGKLVLIHPDILQFSLQYFDAFPSPFEWVSDKNKIKFNVLNYNDIEIAECCYNFLKTAPDIFRKKWKWSDFIERYIQSKDAEVRWLTCQCLMIILGMSEHQFQNLEKIIVGETKFSIDYYFKYTKKLQKNYLESHSDPLDELFIEKPSVLSDHVVDVSGVLLPISDASYRQSGNLVLVKSTVDNLRSLALAIVSGKAVCLIGPVGCGKTALVEYLAHVTGRQNSLRKVQLGDQTDSRSLLGTYRCTDIPGEFVWQAGVLTQAVQKGQWLLLEDIDCAATDIASVLSSLLERNVLSVPGYRDSIPITPGFQLFFTQRTVNTVSGYRKPLSNASALLQKHWTQINVEPLSRCELISVVEDLFPKLKTISSKMVDVFLLFSVGSHQSSLQSLDKTVSPVLTRLSANISDILSLRSGRLISTRDLIKWCSRATIDFDVSSPESALKVLQDAIDIFACSVADRTSRTSLSIAIGAILGIVESKVEYYCDSYKPTLNSGSTFFHIGRASVAKKQVPISEVNLNEKKVTFSFTRPSTCLLERVACCINMKEPVLLVGETGTGKTSSIQYLAKESGNKLLVINMNQQSDSADLLGGYKPVDMKYIIFPIRNEFEYLFRNYFDGVKNSKFLEYISMCFNSGDWKTLLTLMKQSQAAAIRRLESDDLDSIKCRKRKSDGTILDTSKEILKSDWRKFGLKLAKLELQLKSQASLAFSFIEGSLVKALKEGYWVLLDEINLASAETLECLSGLLESHSNSINLLERGDDFFVKRDPEFKLFACMNPATDIGKRDLPVGLRNRFTEFFVEELTDKNDLLLLIGDYLKDMSLPQSVYESVYKFYISIGKEAKLNLMDGTGQQPHYSLRTLCRALSAAVNANCGTLVRSLYEAMCLSFLTQLDSISYPKVQNMIAIAVLGKKTLKSILQQAIPQPKNNKNETFLCFEGYWICKGPLEPIIPDDYILTPSVRKNLKDLARIISLGKLPILLQGDTSVGKTSLITYLAKASGNYCVRINNHQHTDIQEYIGSYATDSSGKLIFREGVLVEAMRKGHWIILDELNLAPSDVLEALNRVLDDNKELFIPETQQVVKAHPKFMLFATQNPPGLYGGRNLLSRAFRNRFIELHFDEIPKPELEMILHQRCHMPLSYCKKVLLVMAELQVRRRGSAAVQGKEGFITLRDLFRWGQRYKIASNHDTLVGKYYDWEQHIADEGYLVLAGRVRHPDERLIIQEVLQKHIKRVVNPDNLFSLHEKTSSVTCDILKQILLSPQDQFQNIVWTFNMRRLAVLVAKSFYFKEPVLLVGDTGCGKTTVCQILALLKNSQLLSVNCHMHTEGSDFLGGLRPVRQYNNDGRLFEWVDGPLIDAMKFGYMFLADEISLADDSVLERLNSLLEPERQILLSEKGLSVEENSAHIVSAVEEFRFIGTMNPGGDYGKKELSPALRNRFTEIWCDSTTNRDDLYCVLRKSLKFKSQTTENSIDVCKYILDFIEWFQNSKVGERFTCSIRDLLSWINFINEVTINSQVGICEAYLHGACLVFLDSFGTSILGVDNILELNELKHAAVEFLMNQMTDADKIKNYEKLLLNTGEEILAQKDSEKFGINPFFIDCLETVDETKSMNTSDDVQFNFLAPTTGVNTLRILRGLQLSKPILLEGSPGVGKTSLVTALAKTSGHKILRINLSDQTDISDLFGADLPTSDGSFTWKDGAFLTALKNGDWILLDELNLAPQSVLEGLNACLDHRGEIFIPELGKSFSVTQETKIFACQNPLRQGGARRGLPKSFLNRFTQVYIDTLSPVDLNFIISSQYPIIPHDLLDKMIKFNDKILKDTTDLLWGYKGSPWELNLRDIQRWCDGVMKDFKTVSSLDDSTTNEQKSFNPGKFAKLLYVDRMRTYEDKQHVKNIYDDIFCPDYPMSFDHSTIYVTKNQIHIGDSAIERNISGINKGVHSEQELLVLRHQLPILKSLLECTQMNWLSILLGPTASGKTSSVQVLSRLLGRDLKVLPVTSAMDTADILGGFEQADYNRHLEEISFTIENIVLITMQQFLFNNCIRQSIDLLKEWEIFKGYECHDNNDNNKLHTMEDETKSFLLKHKQLIKIIDLLLKHEHEDTTTIVDAKNKLQNLETLVLKEQSINAGGKFEWIDSLLIKCLLDGCWLLVDNVNLCSSAVLDRLNCLLEPQGVLTIPERGDQLNEIKPHKNFRMFFTMDPKNGEISRAMRNRGVEIYIIGNGDYVSDSITDVTPLLDLTALLQSTELPIKYIQFFIRMHKSMCSYIKGCDKPTQCHLIQSSSLTCQQLQRGENALAAIVSSFSDVYIKPRTSFDFVMNNMSLADCKIEMLNHLIDSVKVFCRENSIDFIAHEFSRHTLSCKILSESSSLEKIKQDSYFLNKTLDNHIMQFDDELIFKLSHLFYNYYHLSSVDDISDRHEFVNRLIGYKKNFIDGNLQNWCLTLNKSLYEAISQNARKKNIAYPCDMNVVSDIIGLNTNFEEYNNLNLFIYFLSMIAQNQSKDVNYTTILDHSKNVCNEKYNDMYLGAVLVKHCFLLYDKLVELIKQTIIHRNTRITHEKLNKLFLLLTWMNKFYKVCNAPMFSSSRKSKSKHVLKQDSIENLIIHYKWLSKYLIKELTSMCESHVSIHEISQLITDIDKSLVTLNSPFKKFYKRYISFTGQPLPHPSNDMYAMCSKRAKIVENSVFNKMLKINGPVDNSILDTPKLESRLCLFSSVKNSFGLPNECYKEILESFNIESTAVPSTSENSTIVVKLWPIQDFIVQKINNIYQVELFRLLLNNHYKTNCRKELCDVAMSNSRISEKLLSHLLIPIKKVEFFPIQLHSILSNLLENFDIQDESCLSLLQHSSEIWDLITQYKENSPVTRTKYWLESLHNMNTSEEMCSDVPISYEPLPLSFPHMTHFTIKYILNESSSLNKDNSNNKILSSSLVSLQKELNQLTYYHNLLWKNICILSNTDLQHLCIDVKIILLNYERTVLCLEDALIKSRTTEHTNDIKQIVLNCTDIIDNMHDDSSKHFTKEMIDFKNTFNKCLNESADVFLKLRDNFEQFTNQNDENHLISILTGCLWTLFGFCNVMLLSNIGTVDKVRKDEVKLNYLKENLKTTEFLLDGNILHNILSGRVPVSDEEAEAVITYTNCEEMIPSSVQLLDHNVYNINKASLYGKLLKSCPHHSDLIETKSTIDEKLKNNFEGKTYRPVDPTYSELVKEYNYFLNSLGNANNIMMHYNNMKEVCNILYQTLTGELSNTDLKNKFGFINDIVKAYSIWRLSVKQFYKKISDKFSAAFPDIVLPFLNGITQLCYGFDLLRNFVKKQLTKFNFDVDNNFSVSTCMENLIRFPIVDDKCHNILQLVDCFSSTRFLEFLTKGVSTQGQADNLSKTERYRLLKVNFQELYCKCISDGTVENSTWEYFTSILTEFVATWQKQCENLEKKKQEDDSLYINKVKCKNPSEEEQIEEEVCQLFPSYVDLDFSDFKTLDFNMNGNSEFNTKKENTDAPLIYVTQDDINFIVSVHSSIMKNYTWAEWLPFSKSEKLSCDYLSPLFERYNISANLLDNICHGLNESFDFKMLPSLLVLIAQTRSSINNEEVNSKFFNTNKKPNFYQNAWVVETKRCLPVLETIKERTEVLLEEWPDFPTLRDIKIVTERILNFSITSPVVRFLTGLELLRDKIEEWNKNANKSNSMDDLALMTAQQIVSWRKLELANWKDSLNSSFDRLESQANKWWFHIYTLIDCYICQTPVNSNEVCDVTPNATISTQQFIEAMQNFLEKSPLVEYNKRLNILYGLHCHVIHVKPSARRDEVICILWNIYKYYSQFSSIIVQKIKEKRTPIEKKLRDFVKICTWERDLSYWAVKDLVDKAHKTLHKHIKEFEGILQSPVNIYFLIEQSVDSKNELTGLWDRPKRSTPVYANYSVDCQLYLISPKLHKKCFASDDVTNSDVDIQLDLSDGSLLHKIESLTSKAKTFCKTIFTSSTYPMSITKLDNFVTQIIETVQYLKALEVSPNLPKEKQKSQVKGFLQQKKKCLSDLFQTLKRIGVNYKTGLMEITTRNGNLLDYLLPPLDLECAFSYLKNKRCDSSLLSYWQGCDLYFQRCITRMKGLNTVLLKPSSELGMQIIERFKGYTAHLLITVQTQKSKVINYSKILCYLRQKLTHVNELCETNYIPHDQVLLISQWQELKEVYNTVITTVEQFDLVLQSIPENGEVDEAKDVNIDFDDAISHEAFVKCYKYDTSWNFLTNSVKQILTLAYRQQTTLNDINLSFPASFIYDKKIKYGQSSNFTHYQIDLLKKAISTITPINDKICEVILKFSEKQNAQCGRDNFRNPITNCLVTLYDFLQTKSNKFAFPENNSCLDNEDVEMPQTNIAKDFCSQLEELVKSSLVVIQENFKNINPDLKVEFEEKEDSCELPENLLKQELQENITSNVENLRMHSLCYKLDLILLKFNEMTEDDAKTCKKQLSRCIPLLEQICLFAQFFIMQQIASHRVCCKMLSVILNIFIEMSSKGFCTPAGFEDESGEGEGQSKQSGGMGLGDGEGEKDVSEEIENQDQLEDALKPGEEKHSENKDCKEESKGVEMTDDFESHLQDVEGNNDDSEDSDDNDDADKQMGETDLGAEKLDEQMWGSDDDEEEDENKNTKEEKEERGKGEPLDDKQMSAKDDKNKQSDDVADDKDSREKQKDDINKMDEPEYDEDHVDPYHGNQKPLPEPEAMDLPDDLNLDGDDDQKNENENEDENENNPFEIDVFKDKKSDEDQDQDKESEEKGEQGKNNEKGDDPTDNENDSDEENENLPDTEIDNMKNDMEAEDVGEDEISNDQEVDSKENEEDTQENNDVDTQNMANVKQDDIEEMESEDTENELNKQASHDKPSNEDKIESAAVEKGSKDLTQTNPQVEKEKEPAPFEQSQEQEGDEQEGVGQSELSLNQKGHMGNRKDKPQSNFKDNLEKENEKQLEKRNRPGDTEQERALGEIQEPIKKKSKTLNIKNKENKDEGSDQDDGADDNGEDSNVDVYQHIKEAKQSDSQIVDAATDEQANKQPIPNKPDEDVDDPNVDKDVEIDIDEDIDVIDETPDKVRPEKLGQDKNKKNEKSSNKGEPQEEPTGEIGVEVDGEKVPTIGVQRGSETTYHTKLDKMKMALGSSKSNITGTSIRQGLENHIFGNSSADDNAAWHSLWGKTSAQAKLLTEKLRLVLEPTGLSRLAGDYRTGKRINMRRVIPYIASHFRKDRIWLRRTRPARREYHIALAIDDSSSMGDNQSKELAFESLALVSQALNLLEAGDLAVLSFGEDTKILHSFSDQFTENSGCKLIHNLTFEQRKTRIANMLDFSSTMFEEFCCRSNAPNAKLLLIVSDGRGIFSEGETKVLQTIRRIRQQGVFIVYLIVDNPANETSIMDIRVPLFDPQTNQLKCIQPYLDNFPFPFYLILRDITSLPSVLSDAMRQWFELAANIDK